MLIRWASSTAISNESSDDPSTRSQSFHSGLELRGDRSGAYGRQFQSIQFGFFSAEVEKKASPIPSADLYSVGLVMIDILGGDIEKKTTPDSVNEEIQKFLRFHVMPSRLQRSQDAWEMHRRLALLIRKLWGPPKFREFKM